MVSVATNLAHDGIASPVASLEDDDGRKGSYGVHIPIAVVVDLDYVRRSPAEQLRSGIGDALSNLSALADWELAAEDRGEPVDGLAAAFARAGAESLLTAPTSSARTAFQRTLAEALVLSGLAMAVAGSSRPCSGACHEISHAIDALYPEQGEPRRAGGRRRALRLLPARGRALRALDAALRRHGVARLPERPRPHGRGVRGRRRRGAFARDPTATRSSSTSTSARTRSATGSRASSMPSIAELRAETQPDWLLARPGAEHWAGRLYMRRLSPYLTRIVLATPLPANGVTALMIPAGLLAAVCAHASTGSGPRSLAVLLVQLQLLLDCSDGEVARWRQTFSPAGVYLDQLAHYSTEAAIPAALGVRADGGWDSIGGWTALGLLTSVLILFLKSETHLVQYALRARTGRPRPPRGRAGGSPRLLPAFRPFHAVEASLLALAAAVVDALDGRPRRNAGSSRRARRRPQSSRSSGTSPPSSPPAASSEGTGLPSD